MDFYVIFMTFPLYNEEMFTNSNAFTLKNIKVHASVPDRIKTV